MMLVKGKTKRNQKSNIKKIMQKTKIRSNKSIENYPSDFAIFLDLFYNYNNYNNYVCINLS